MSPNEEFPEAEDITREERELKEEKDERDQKEEEIPENANPEKISMETLLKVFGGGSEVLDANRFASYLKIENIYAEVGCMEFLQEHTVLWSAYAELFYYMNLL